MQIEEQVRAEIVEVGRRLHAREFVAANDGNIVNNSGIMPDPHRIAPRDKLEVRGFPLWVILSLGAMG